MIFLAAIVAGLVYSLFFVVMAVPGGLFLMLLMAELHGSINVGIPMLSYADSYTLALLGSLTLVWLVPRSVPSTNN